MEGLVTSLLMMSPNDETVSYIGCTDWEYNFSVILPFGLGGSLCILGTAYRDFLVIKHKLCRKNSWVESSTSLCYSTTNKRSMNNFCNTQCTLLKHIFSGAPIYFLYSDKVLCAEDFSIMFNWTFNFKCNTTVECKKNAPIQNFEYCELPWVSLNWYVDIIYMTLPSQW